MTDDAASADASSDRNVAVDDDGSTLFDSSVFDGGTPSIDGADVGIDAIAMDEGTGTDSGPARDVITRDAPRDATPVIHPFAGQFLSPSIVRVGSTYHVWVAQQNINGRRIHIPHATFTADGDFTGVHEALPNLGRNAVEGDAVWAPGVARIDATHWMLYYSSTLAGTTDKKCLWRAHASSPDGPFVDDYGGPMYCAPNSLWSIDAYPLRDARGNWQLGARIDQTPPPGYPTNLGGVNTISVRRLTADGQNFESGFGWLELTNNRFGWEQPVMENAGIVRLTPPGAGAAHWFVFYSARSFRDNSYAIGYADCGEGLTDNGCTKVTTDGPWLATDAAAGVFAPGTPTFYTNEAGDMMMSVQAWPHTGGLANPANRGHLTMRTYRISVNASYRPSVSLFRVDTP